VSTIRLLTQIKHATTHKETLLTINWEGVTDEQMKVWATAHIISLCQARWAKEDKKIPETFTFTCADHPVHQAPMLPWMQEFSCPPAQVPGEDTKKARWDRLLDSLALLTPEEQEELFRN